MPFIKLDFKPGVNRDTTNYANKGGWFECDKIRFLSGFPQKLGGWIKSTPESFVGTARQLWNWITSFSDNLLALGTEVKTYIEVGGIYYDITPLRVTFDTDSTPSSDNCISTTNTSKVITFTLQDHGCLTGDYVTISGVAGSGSPEAIAGIPVSEINAEHVVTYVDADNFTITVTTAATSTTSSQGGTAIEIACQIHPGYSKTTLGYGFGTDTYSGAYGWGLAGTVPISLQQRDWFFDNIDNDLVMNVRNGPIYYWERGSLTNPSTALGTRAVELSSLNGSNSVPTAAMQILVSQNDKHVLAFGCQPYAGASTDFDPLLIRWSNQDEPQVWNPSTTNSAGFIRVSRGSEIVRALATRQEILVWTNATLSSLQFLGTTDVFGIQELADNISIMSPRAVATANNVVYWMGRDKFYAYSGQVITLPCTLRNHVFNDINYGQIDQVIAGTNEKFNEIWWFYPSANSTTNDQYVIFNYQEQIWYYGTINRTAWLDSPNREKPLATNTANDTTVGYLYRHEDGVNDDETAMTSYIQSSDIDLSDGYQFMLTKRMIPDIDFAGSTVDNPEATLTIRPRNFPGSDFGGDATDSQQVIETSVGAFTNQVYIRARARQVALKVQSVDGDTQWQLGSIRLDVRPDGRR